MWGGFFNQAAVVPQHTGFMGDLSDTQTKVLDEIREWVANENLDPIKQFDDYDLLRFCRARKFQVVLIKEMFINFLA